MSYLLDTNVLSELRKGPRCNTHVAVWFAPMPNDEIYLSVLVIGEIRRGIERLRSRDPQAATALEGWLTQVVTGHRGRYLGSGPCGRGGMGPYDCRQALIDRRQSVSRDGEGTRAHVGHAQRHRYRCNGRRLSEPV